MVSPEEMYGKKPLIADRPMTAIWLDLAACHVALFTRGFMYATGVLFAIKLFAPEVL